MKDNKLLFILLGVGAGVGIYFFLCSRKNKEQLTETKK